MPSTDRPNILLILTDQHRWDTLGCYGAASCRTPHLDALAARGVRFDAAYCPTSPCSPARAALFCGLYPHKNGVPSNGGILEPGIPNLAESLAGANYNLGYAGKWHVDNARVPSEYGFRGKDFPGYGQPTVAGIPEGLRYGRRSNRPTPHYGDYLREHGYENPRVLEAHYGDNPGKQDQEMYALQSGGLDETFEAMVAAEAVDHLRCFGAESRESGKPFFVWANFWGPHTPCLVPEPYYSMYDPADIPPEPSYAETWADKPRVHALYERFWSLSGNGWAGWREIVARYWGYVTMLDDLVGRILAELRAQGLEENTLVVFGTDHGDQMGAHRMIEKGPFAYEESWRLPLIAAHPACENPGSVCDEFVLLNDLFPTFLETAGVTPPEVPDNRSILPQVLGRAEPTGRDSVYGAFHAHLFPAPLRFVRTKRHKLVFNQVDMGELYDVIDDPWELHNRFNDPAMAEVKAQLMARLREHMETLQDPILPSFDRIKDVY